MKGVWKDGHVRFQRDNNVKNRGRDGRELGAGRFGWMEWVRGAARKFVARQFHKAERRQVQALIEEQIMAEEARIIEEEALRAKEAEEWAHALAWVHPWEDPRFYDDEDREYFADDFADETSEVDEPQFYEAGWY